MNVLTDIFSEYINMRTSGLTVPETSKTLSQYIDALPKAQKHELGNYVRTWEKKNGTAIAAAKTGETPAVQKVTTGEFEAAKKSVTTVKSLKEIATDAAWITCANCDRKNRIDAVFCYACGHMLEQLKGKYNTRQFTDAVDNYAPHYFGRDSIMVLRMRDTEQEFELRPQKSDKEVVMGRNTENSPMSPDIDLSSVGAGELGVSRLHIAFRYDPESEAIQIYDLGSANGSFVNGQKLHPKEVRILRNGDELRLGKLVLRVTYYHPGSEIVR